MKPIITILVMVCFLVGTQPSVFCQNPEKTYQKALVKEEGEGALTEAIALYKQVADNTSAGNSLQAKALLHVGLCYEKLGKEEAMKAYQKLVADFPGQKSEVEIARERLKRLIQPKDETLSIPIKPSFRKVLIPTKFSWDVKLSPDGNHLALVSENKLWKVPLKSNLGSGISGTPVHLQTDGIDIDPQAGLSWSADGKWIAFSQMPLKDNPENKKLYQNMFVVSVEGGNPKKVLENFRAARLENYRIGLSPDGKMLAHTTVNQQEQHIYTTPLTGQEPKKLVDSQAREPVYSPDGKWIAYVEDKRQGYGGGDLWIVPVSGETPIKIAEAGYATNPTWSPDSKMLAFWDGDDNEFIKIVPIPDHGKQIAEPTSIKLPESEGVKTVRVLSGWTPDNRLGTVLEGKDENALFTLPVDGGQATMILHDTWAMMPRWSRDGKSIYYVTPETGGSQEAFSLLLASVPVNGGSGKRIYSDESNMPCKQLGNQGGNRISPDGKSILSSTWVPEEYAKGNRIPMGIWEFAIDGSRARRITSKSSKYVYVSPSWSPDGEKVAFMRLKLARQSASNLDTVFLATMNSSGNGESIVSTHIDEFISSPIWSPDGKMIAYLSAQKEAPKKRHIKFIDPQSGDLLKALEINSYGSHIELSWSPDSKWIAFNEKDGKLIKIVNVNDGDIRSIKTNLVDVDIQHLDWSPDGENFVFAGKKKGNAEFWFVENFLQEKILAQMKDDKEQEGVTIQQLPEFDGVDFGTFSCDGEYFSMMDGETGNVALYELKTKKKMVLTSEGTWNSPMQFANLTRLSHNNKKVAYSWQKVDKGNKFDLRIMDIENPNPKILYEAGEGEVHPAFWTSDDKNLVAYTINNDTCEIFTFDLINGSYKELHTYRHPKGLPALCCSNDENYIAYNYLNPKNNQYDINLIPVNGGKEIPLIDHPANDEILGWFPGRNELLFLSDRRGSEDIWSVTVLDGKISGPCNLLYKDIGKISTRMITEDGTLYFSKFTRRFNSFYSPFNVHENTADITSSKYLLGSNYGVQWSPDGKTVVYNKEKPDPQGVNWQLILRNEETGKEQHIAKNLYTGLVSSWSPDGKKILTIGVDKSKSKDKSYFAGIYSIDVETGLEKKLITFSRESFTSPSMVMTMTVEWAPDGKGFYYSKEKQIFHYDPVTGKEKVFYDSDKFLNYLKLSPSGKELVFREGNSIVKSSVDDGKTTLVATLEDPKFKIVDWSLDENYFYLVDKKCLCKIPSGGGGSIKICDLPKNMRYVAVRPDEKEIVITTYDQQNEFRKIENLDKELDKIYTLNDE